MESHRKVSQTHHHRITQNTRNITDDVLSEHQSTIVPDTFDICESWVKTHNSGEDPDLLIRLSDVRRD